jgi:hypothetical protein
MTLGLAIAVGTAVPVVAAPASVTVSVTDAKGSSIAGLVVTAVPIHDGQPFETATVRRVEAFPVHGAPDRFEFDGSASLVDGQSYTLLFELSGSSSTPAFTQLLGGVIEWNRADTFIAGSASPRVDATLRSNAVLTGTVKTSTNHYSSGAIVTVFWFDGTKWSATASTTTSSKGKYTIRDLIPGIYRVGFSAPNKYPPTWGGSSASFATATGYSVGLGQSVTVNAKFSKGGTLTGSVKLYDDYDEVLVNIAGIYPIAYPLLSDQTNAVKVDRSQAYVGTRSSKSGTWSINGLPAGEFAVELVSPYVDVDSGFVSDQTIFATLESYAKTFTVSSAKTTKVQRAWMSFQDYSDKGEISLYDSSYHPLGSGFVVYYENERHPEVNGYLTTNDQGKAVITADDAMPKGYYTFIATDPDLAFAPKRSEGVNVYWNPFTYSMTLSAFTSVQFSSSPSIAETSLTVGTTYVVSAATNPADSTKSYQWLRNGSPIYGATKATYTSRGSDSGSVLSVRVSASSFGKYTATAYAEVGEIESGQQLVSTTPPSITFSGASAHVDSVLGVKAGKWNASSVDLSYSWSVNGVSTGVDSSTYTVSLDDVNEAREITATVVASAPGYADSDPVATAAVIPGAAPAPSPKSTFTVKTSTKGLPKGSTKYTVSPGTWTIAGLDFSYQWFIDGESVGNESSYISSAADAPGALVVMVSAGREGYTTAEVAQVVRKGKQALVAGTQPSVAASGAGEIAASSQPVEVDDVLTVTAGEWQVPAGVHVGDPTEPASISYQWYRKKGSSKTASISGAKASSYRVTSSDVGSTLSVKVTLSSKEWAGVTRVVSAGKGVLSTALSSAKPTLTVGGPARQTEFLTVTPGSWGVPGVTVSRHWYRCTIAKCPSPYDPSTFDPLKFTVDKNIDHFADDMYYIVSGDVGGQIFYAEVASKKGYATATAYSNVVTINGASELTALTAPALGGNVGQGTVPVRGNVSVGHSATYKETGISRSYILQLCTEAVEGDCTSESNWSDIGVSSPSGVSRVVSAADYGTGHNQIRVVETATKLGYGPLRTASAPVRIVEGSYSTVFAPVSCAIGSSNTTSINCTLTPPTTVVGTTWQSADWYSGETLLGSGTTLVATNPDRDQPLYVIVTYPHTDGYRDDIAFMALRPHTKPAITVPTISGHGFGSTMVLSSSNLLPNAPAALLRYTSCYTSWPTQGTVVDSQTSGGALVYQPAASEVGSPVNVYVSCTNDFMAYGYSAFSTRVYSDPVDPLPIQGATDPAITFAGTPIESSVLSAVAPSFSTTGVSISYQWEMSDDGVDWVPVAGATESRWTIPNRAVSSFVRLTSTGSKPGYASVTRSSVALEVSAPGVLVSLVAPHLTNAKVGEVLVASPGSWGGAPTFSYAWFRNGALVEGATTNRYEIDPTAAGDEIVVLVTARQVHQRDLTVSSNVITVALGSAPTPVSLPKKSVSGAIATVKPGTWSVSGLTLSYQWFDHDVAIDGATTSSYELTDEQLAEDIHVQVTASAIGYQPGTVFVP